MSRRPLVTVVLVLVAALLGYGLTRLVLRPPAPDELSSPEARMAWMEREFALSADACAQIKRLQSAYDPVCEKHCAAIVRAQAALRAAGDDPTARAAAQAELARLKQVCAESTRAHLQAVAAQMPPAEAGRFMAMMEHRIAHHDARTGAPALAPASAP